MPDSIVEAWVFLAIWACLLAVLYGVQSKAGRVLPKRLWMFVRVNCITACLFSGLDLIPFYLWGSRLPLVWGLLKGAVTVFVVVGSVAKYLYIDWASIRREWDDQ